MDKLEELVYLTIGRASMCWSEMHKGVFNDTYAQQIARELLDAISQHEEERVALESAKWHLSHPHIIRDANGQEIARSKGLDIFEKTYEPVEQEVEHEQSTAEANAKIMHMKGLL